MFQEDGAWQPAHPCLRSMLPFQSWIRTSKWQVSNAGASHVCFHDLHVPDTGKGYVDASTVDAETAKQISKVSKEPPAAVTSVHHPVLGSCMASWHGANFCIEIVPLPSASLHEVLKRQSACAWES